MQIYFSCSLSFRSTIITQSVTRSIADGGAEPSSGVPHDEPTGRPSAHLFLLTTELVNLPKPLPSSSNGLLPPGIASSRGDLMGRVIRRETSSVSVWPELAVPSSAGPLRLDTCSFQVHPHDPAQGPVTEGIKTRLQSTK